MGTVLHSKLNDPELHESKGADASLVDQYFVSDGAGSGDWTRVLNKFVIHYRALNSWGFRSPIKATLTYALLDYWFPHSFEADRSELHINGVNIPGVVSDDPTPDTFEVQERLIISGAPTIEIGDEIQFYMTNDGQGNSNYVIGGQMLILEEVV